MPRSKILLSIIALVSVAGLSAWTLLNGGNGTEYRTAAVERGDVAYTVSATGNPNAVVTVQVGSQVSGNIQALYADFNTRVKKDQLVARIDPQIFQARVDQAQANVEAARASVVNAQANLQKAQAGIASAVANQSNSRAEVLKAQVAVQDAQVKYERRQKLATEGVISREDLDTAQNTYNSALAALDAAKAQQQAAADNVKAAQADAEVSRTQLVSAQAQVKQAQAALEQSDLDLEHTYIRAPVDGVVVARNVDVGQTVAASLQAPTLFQIAQDLTNMQVDTNVSEADVGRVRVGQPATFTVDAYPGREFHGQVRDIRKAPINVQNVITYDVVIGVANPDLKLFPGMTANVKILVDQHDNVLKVPNAALRFKPEGTEPRKAAAGETVWVLTKDNEPKAVPVSVGLNDGASTEITKGDLQAGDKVIVAAFSKKDSGAASSAGPHGRRGPF